MVFQAKGSGMADHFEDDFPLKRTTTLTICFSHLGMIISIKIFSRKKQTHGRTYNFIILDCNDVDPFLIIFTYSEKMGCFY